MGLFDSIAGEVMGALAGKASELPAGLSEIVTGLINNPQTGGLQGLVNAFEANGLGHIVASWIGTGENLPISAEQIQAVLGNQQVQEIAQRFGLPVDVVSGFLAKLLPAAVDQATPDGQLPQG